jgi:hypothetical protein
MERVKNQHYVPQFYLKWFCSDGHTLFVFDKPSKKVFRTGSTVVASEQRFYDLPLGHSTDFQAVEKAFSTFEDQTASAICALLGEVEQKQCFEAWNPDCRTTLALYLVLQDCRTRQFRSSISNLFQQLGKRIAAMHEFARAHLEERGDRVVVQPVDLDIDVFELDRSRFDLS